MKMIAKSEQQEREREMNRTKICEKGYCKVVCASEHVQHVNK
jgi:hypothetical protein